MELPIYISTRATLVNAYWSDLKNSEGIFNFNSIFFLKDEITKEFYSTYKLHDNDWIYKPDFAKSSEKYFEEEVNYLVNKRLIYKLSTNNNNKDFEFRLYLKRADLDSIFFCPQHIRFNRIYYVVDKKSGSIIGPEYTNFETDIEKFKELIENGFIYVPTKKQTFEPFRLAKAS
ncbi:hypothetical protein [Flavobacterium koreense]